MEQVLMRCTGAVVSPRVATSSTERTAVVVRCRNRPTRQSVHNCNNNNNKNNNTSNNYNYNNSGPTVSRYGEAISSRRSVHGFSSSSSSGSWLTGSVLVAFVALLATLQVVCGHKPRNSDFYELRPGQTERGRNITHILNSFFTKGYDKRVRPNYGGPPVKVGVSMQIVSISAVSEVQMDFTSDFYFRQSWRDERLSFPETDELSQMTVGAEVAGKIWVPDTFFANEKTAYFHIATTPNTFLRIGSDGDVYRSIRLTVTASCPMDLRYFPMDRQSCTIEIESFGYTMSDIRYSWRDGEKSVGISEEVQLPQFKIQGHVQKASEVSLSTGNYSRLICEIRFVRSMGYYLIQIYVPAGLIVVISWVSFWLHRNATPARVALGVMTVLTMTTLMSSTNSQLPKISYVKSIDVYLGTCFVMVFASLLEYAAVGYLGKRVAMRKSRAQQLARFQDRKRHQRTLRQLGPTVDEMSPENDPLLTKNYNFNFTAHAPWGGGAPSAPSAPTPVYRPSHHRQSREHHRPSHQRDRGHLDRRKSGQLSVAGGGGGSSGGHMNSTGSGAGGVTGGGRDREGPGGAGPAVAVGDGRTPGAMKHHTESGASAVGGGIGGGGGAGGGLKHGHHSGPHLLQDGSGGGGGGVGGGGGGKPHHGIKHHHLVDKNKNTHCQDQNKADEIEQQIRSEHYSSSGSGGGGGGGGSLNVKLSPNLASRGSSLGPAGTNYYNTLNSKHHLEGRHASLGPPLPPPLLGPPLSSNPNMSSLNNMMSSNLNNFLNSGGYNTGMMNNQASLFHMNALNNHYSLNINNFLDQQMNSLHVRNVMNNNNTNNNNNNNIHINNNNNGGHAMMANHIGPPCHYATMPLPTHHHHHRDGRPVPRARADHLNNSIINPLAMDEIRLNGLNRCDSKVSRKASLSPEGGGGTNSAGGIALLSPGVESVLLQNPNKLCGVSPSDIDKDSRVVFPVCFVCFNLMYWVIYMRISDVKYAEPTVLH